MCKRKHYFLFKLQRTMCKPKGLVCTPRGACKSWRARRVRDRLCQVWLHHVFTSPLEVLGPAWQVQTSCFSGTWFCKNRRWDMSCHGRRIGQDHPGRLKLGPMALPRALYRTHPRVLKSEAHCQFSGVPKMPPRWTFGVRSCCSKRVKCTTHQHNLTFTDGY